MKSHQIIMIVCGLVLAAVCLCAGWFLFSAISAKNTAAEQRNQAYEELQGIYSAKLFPSPENIKRIGDDQKVLEAWLVTASNLLHKGDLQVDKKSPTGFKQVLQATVRELSAYPGGLQGKVVAPAFNFGFDKYLGQSDSLPSAENVDRLTVQLAVIERVCKELFAANILELKAVSRDVFDEAKEGGQEQQEEAPARRSSRRRRTAEASAEPSAPARDAGSASGEFSKQRFTFEFVARPAAFIDALNRLAAMDLFVVVAETEFRKTSDPLAQRAARAAEGAKAPAEGVAAVDPAKLKHVDRIVTDPVMEPPVSVKLDIDVYSFEGV